MKQCSQEKKLISIVSPTFNEIANIEELYRRVTAVMDKFPQYDFEYIVIDNASTDGTDIKLKKIACTDKRLKIIINTRNFGHIRSPYWGIIQSSGSATVFLASDLQDPPELVEELIKLWESGEKVVLATKPVSATNPLFHSARRFYYKFLNKISDVDLVNDSTGFGIYDKEVIDKVRAINDPYPYFRGMVCELGYKIRTVDFDQPARVRGVTKNNFYTLYDIAVLGVISHSLVPIRIATIVGMVLGVFSILAALIMLVLKIVFWSSFPIGVAPLMIGMFFMFGILLFFIGVIGEYIGSIHTFVENRPVVVERERVNF